MKELPRETAPQSAPYEYAVRTPPPSIEVIDGDTVRFMCDLGQDVYKRDTYRLLGINTPEVKGAKSEAEKRAGIEATEVLDEIVRKALAMGILMVRTRKDRRGGRGRYLVRIWAGSMDVNRYMLTNGYAAFYGGRGRMPRFPFGRWADDWKED